MPFEILRKDITKMEVDAIISSTSSLPFVSSGTDQQIHQASGPQLFEERKSFGNIDIGKAILTKGYKLPAKHVIHVVGPKYIDGSHNEKEILYQTYLSALRLAKESDIQSIAFPLISTGTLQFPRGEGLAIALDAIKYFLSKHEMMIYLLVYDEASFQLSLNRFISVKNYLEELAREPERFEFSFNIVKKMKLQTRYLEDVVSQLDETFSNTLFRLIDERELDDVYVYKKANIDRKLFSKIKSNEHYQPSKMTVLAFSFGLELNLDETKDFLMKAGYALSPSSKLDMIVQYFIENKIYDLYEVNQVLFAFDQKTIGGLE